MSDSCASCNGDSCSSAYAPPTTIGTISTDSPSIGNYSPPSTNSIYSDIKTAGGLDAAIDIYGIENLAKDIYLDNSANPEKIVDSFSNTDMHGVDYLPDKIAGMIKSTIGYDSKGRPSIDADIFYNQNLSADDMLYTAIHELAHREQLEYSKNMLLSFSEGDAEWTAYDMINDYVSQLEELYNGSLKTRYTSDPTYNECKAIVTDIYEAIGGRDEFYDVLEIYDGDFFKALDSFESDLNDNGMDLKNVYDALNMLDRELEIKSYDIDNTSQPTSTPYPFADIYTDTMPQSPFGTVGMGMPYPDISSVIDTSNFPLADPFHSNRTNIWDLLREQEEIRERYLQNMYFNSN